MIADCPTQDRLKSLTLGQLPEEQSDVLLRHLEHCKACQQELSQIDESEDTFVRQIKTAGESNASDRASEFETENGCRVAVTRALAALATAEGNGDRLPNVPDSIGEYNIVKPLGAGGMGHVYLGQHTKLNRPVAIKFIADHRRWDTTMHERFESEMSLIGGLKHPNIVVAHDAREVDGLAVLVTEYIDGMTVSEILKRTGKLETADACKIIGEVCEALSYIDSQGLVHRDIKPSNVMIDSDGTVKLLDLGLARLQASDDLNGSPEFTATGQAMGTADYVAPEQVNDSRNVDIRADIYGLGCTFYKLLSGQAPFALRHQTAFAKMNAHVSEVPTTIDSAGIPNDLGKLVDKMLEKNPDDRPQSPGDVLALVEKHSQPANLSELVAQARSMPELKSSGLIAPTENSTTSKPKTEGSFFSKFPWAAAIAGGLAAFAFGLWLGIIITVKKPDGTTSQVEIPDGSIAIIDELGNIEVRLAGSTQKMVIPKEKVTDQQKNKQIANGNPQDSLSDNTDLSGGDGQTSSPAGFPTYAERMIRIDSDSPVFGKVDQGDWVDVLTEGKSFDDGLILPQTLHKKLKVISVQRRGKDIADIDLGIRNTWTRQGKKVVVEFHDPQRQLRLDEIRLEGVWRSVLSNMDGKIVETNALIVFCRDQMITGFEDQLESRRFTMEHRDGENFLIIKGLRSSYRFLKSGRLEISSTSQPDVPDFKYFSRMERVNTANTELEKAAFEIFSSPNDVKNRFECYLAEEYDDDNFPPEDSKVFELDGKSLALVGKPVITNKHVASAKVKKDSRGGFELQIELTGEGAIRMGLATQTALEKKMAIVLDGELVMAPVINAVMYESLVVNGDMEKEELERIAKTIVPTIKLPADLEKKFHRQRSLDNLKQIMLAFHNFESANHRFPTSAMTKGKNGQPYSWRVALLPYLDQQDLYDQYKFDEPWDSDANKKVLNQMPDVFRHPSIVKDSTATNYVGITGHGCALGNNMNKGHSISDVTDGLAFTVFMIESKANIPWTKPEDFPIETIYKDRKTNRKAVSQFEFLDEAGLGAGFGDGAPRFLDRKKLTSPDYGAFAIQVDENGNSDLRSVLVKLFLIGDNYMIKPDSLTFDKSKPKLKGN